MVTAGYITPGPDGALVVNPQYDPMNPIMDDLERSRRITALVNAKGEELGRLVTAEYDRLKEQLSTGSVSLADGPTFAKRIILKHMTPRWAEHLEFGSLYAAACEYYSRLINLGDYLAGGPEMCPAGTDATIRAIQW